MESHKGIWKSISALHESTVSTRSVGSSQSWIPGKVCENLSYTSHIHCNRAGRGGQHDDDLGGVIRTHCKEGGMRIPPERRSICSLSAKYDHVVTFRSLQTSVRPKGLFQFRPKPKFGFLKLPKPNRNRTFGYSAKTGIFGRNRLVRQNIRKIFGRNRLVRQNIWLNMA